MILYRRPGEHPWVTPEELEHIQWDGPSGLSAEKAGAAKAGALCGGGISLQACHGDKAGALSHVRWVELFRYRQAWGLVLARMLADPVWWFYVFWLPEYLRRERDFSLAMIGYFAWIPFLTADAGNFVGGGLSSWLIKRGWPLLRARKVVMFASASVMLVGLPAVLTSSPAWAVALISLATLAYSSWAANILTLPADLFPRGVVASVSGLSGSGAGIGGMTFTLVVGAVVDRFSYVPVFTAAALMPLVAATIILLSIHRPIGQKE
ncbi:MAG: MFS transporter [Acidobacteria bacterium]|nr:MFS transporter [Acidobacteriota bacterium]